MGQKIHPKSFRLGINKNWSERWLASKKTRPIILEEDVKIRNFLNKKLRNALMADVEIERLENNINLIIKTARPGVIIGRGGKGIEDLKKEVEKIIRRHRKERKYPLNYVLNISIEEVKNPTANAAIVAQSIAASIEKRMPYRRLMKKAIEDAKQNKEVKGIKIKLSGRLNGVEIARSEWLDWGAMPLQTIRADIDYSEATAFCTYGTIGIKVWIYKGEIFDKNKNKEGISEMSNKQTK
ncbi:MAG: 30S ribosomal protein S3 [Candidatus Paceibacterota bacterium]|nr:30S ribosomal protein S3 [Candidatus Paceibacterota bacterium]